MAVLVDAFNKESFSGHCEISRSLVVVSDCAVCMCRHCPDNREVLLTGSGAGTLSLYQYHYPDKRTRVDKETGDKVHTSQYDHPSTSVLCTQVGVAGTMTRLQAQQISDQPVNCLDWSPDKLGLIVTSAFDQRIRIVIITKLNLL